MGFFFKKKLNLGIKFSLMVGAILLLFCAIFSLVLYAYLRNQVINEAEEKSMIIVANVRALGQYVNDQLRPKMYEILASTRTPDPFVIEAMSSTHVKLEVMKRFSEDLPEYLYKRVSNQPLNVENKADQFHEQLQQYFEKRRDKKKWHGIVAINGTEHLVTASAVVTDSSCLVCHGSRDESPKSIRLKYGSTASFGWKKDSVVGVETVSIPLDIALARVRKVALDTFTFGSVTLCVLFIAIYSTFRLLVTRPLNRLSFMFQRIAEGTEPLGRDIAGGRTDEIGDLTQSFNILSRHLLAAQEKLKKTVEIEKQMMETEKLASLGQLSAGVAHEINNPLGGIKLCFNNLMNIEMEDDRKKQHIDIVNSGFDRIQNIVKGLLDFSKNAPLSLAPSLLNRIAEDILNLTEYTISKKGISLVKEMAADMPALNVDANKLEQVLLNLIINAVHAMEHGGTLTIRTWFDGISCGFSVGDTGKGISAAVLSKIYDPFFSTKGVGEGTGLGLTVSKAIVEQHGGEIVVKTSDSGTTFTVRLPRARP